MLADPIQLAAFAERWKVSRIWLFGSLARGDASPSSDADILLEFHPDSTASTFDWPVIREELEALLGRRVDLLSTGVLSNPFRRKTILATRKLLYAREAPSFV